MKILVLNSIDVEKTLDLDELRLHMKEALASFSLGQSQNILKQVSSLGKQKDLGFMPFVSTPLQLMGYKAVTVFPENASKNLNPHQGAVALLDFETGELKCLAEGSTITALRTAAVSAMATDLLSRKDSKILAIIGAGRQAREHIRAISRVRKLREIRVFSRDPGKTERLVGQLAPYSRASIIAVNDVSDALREADIVATCTASTEPIFDVSKLESGAHVNAIGASMPGFREIEIHYRQNLRIFLDNQSACRAKADEIFRSQYAEKISNCVVGEIGEVLANLKPGRTSDQDITFFKSVGLAVEDIFAADLAYRRAHVHANIGTRLNFTADT